MESSYSKDCMGFNANLIGQKATFFMVKFIDLFKATFSMA